jgi:hypothetical protein
MRVRSGRFAAVVLAYVAVCAVPPCLLVVIASRSRYFIGGEAFASGLMLVQPLATAVFAGVAAIDALTRERDEGSFQVTSLSRSSAAGYVMRRWLAVVAIIIPLTLIPVLIAFGAASVSQREAAPFVAFLLRWAVQIAPVAVIFSALSIALGTVSGRPAVAVIVAAVLFTAGFSTINDIAAHTHRHFDGLSGLVMPDPMQVQQLSWALAGWATPDLPTDAGYDVRNEAAAAVPTMALPAALACVLFGLTPLYVRRTRRDIQPWRIAADSPVRTLLVAVNRIRTELAPDGLPGISDRLAAVGGLVAGTVVVVLLARRYDRFARLASDSYEALQHGPGEMAAAVLPEAVELQARIAGGEMHSQGTMVLRNTGGAAMTHLAFEVSPSIRVRAISLSRGTAAMTRRWNRLGVDVSPALAPGESRRLQFTLDGRPGSYRFPFRGTFADSYRVFRRATTSVDLTDLSRSYFDSAVSSSRLLLRAADLAPVPRYTPWKAGDEENTPVSDVRIRLSFPALVAGDACGTVGRGRLSSACRIPLAAYAVIGARYRTAAAGDSATLLYLDAHRGLVALHAASLAEAMRRAREAWPSVVQRSHVLFIEVPTERAGLGPRRWWDETIRMMGRAYALPERMLSRKQAVDPSAVAASLIANAVETQRGIAASDVRAFHAFVETVAAADTGSRHIAAVVPGAGAGAPVTEPLLSARDEPVSSQRIAGVVAELEYRVGHDRLKDAISEFVHASASPGTTAGLIETIGRHGGIDLRRFYSDYFTGDALPRLTLGDVALEKHDAGWVISGTLVNKGSGESFCPVVLRTSAGSMTQTIRVDSRQSVPFRFVTTAAPSAVQLDPLKICYRYAFVGSVDVVELKSSDS